MPEFKIQNKIFEYFGIHAKRTDALKDGSGKGIWERYNESLALYYDEELSILVDLIHENLLIPDSMLPSIIPTMERSLGEPVIILEEGTILSETYRRKILKFIHTIYNIRGTETSYRLLFKMLGFDTVNIQEFVDIAGFDSDVTFDDEVRTFDLSNTCGCAEYSIITTGSITLTGEIIQGIGRIVEFLEPINASLRDFTYNGDLVELNLIFVKIIDGVLVYDNANDPGIILELIDGVLYKDGASASFYILQNGLLIYTT